MVRLSLQEANKLLKKGKIIRQVSPENITMRKLWKDCYQLVNVEQKVVVNLNGERAVTILKCNSFYFEK